MTKLFLLLTKASTVYAATLTNPIVATDPNAIIGNIIKGLLGIVGSLALVLFILWRFKNDDLGWKL